MIGPVGTSIRSLNPGLAGPLCDYMVVPIFVCWHLSHSSTQFGMFSASRKLLGLEKRSIAFSHDDGKGAATTRDQKFCTNHKRLIRDGAFD
jgi:hypothetical protein